MVDVGGKNETRRVAQATGHITMSEAAFAQLSAGTAHKGDVLGVARIAAISASKQTAHLIPLCHPLGLTRVAVDFALHTPHGATDIRNHHAHVMMTTRTVTAEGLGEKTLLERENKWLLAQGLATTDVQIRDLRQAWEGVANEHLARAGLDVRIDHRSHLTRGLSIEPTEHMGVHATQMQRKGMEVSRGRLDEAADRKSVV